MENLNPLFPKELLPAAPFFVPARSFGFLPGAAYLYPKTTAMNQVKLRISGKVQGVFFRASTQEKAQELGLKGWVRNEPDGSVTAVARGEDAAVQQWVEWCHRGPEQAQVEQVEIEQHTGELPGGFEIKR